MPLFSIIEYPRRPGTRLAALVNPTWPEGFYGVGMTNTCRRCDEVAHIRPKSRWLCKKHYRFTQMRAKCKTLGKRMPSYEWLELESGRINDKCPSCHRIMNWLKGDGVATVVTLQHDRSGEMRLLCLSCNTRHAYYPDDMFYQRDEAQKWCPRCKQELALDNFKTKKRKSQWLDRETYCIQCNRDRQADWASKQARRKRQAKWQSKHKEAHCHKQQAYRLRKKLKALI